MRPESGRKLLIATLAAAALSSSLYAADDLPKRKSGLWEIKMSMDGQPAGASKMQTCVDEKSDDLTQQQAQAQTKKSCSQNETRRDGDRVIVHSVCQFGQTTATSDAVFSGRFDATYRGEIKTAFSPALAGRSETHMTVEAQWLGPCKAGQRPGDVIVNGQVVRPSAAGAPAAR